LARLFWAARREGHQELYAQPLEKHQDFGVCQDDLRGLRDLQQGAVVDALRGSLDLELRAVADALRGSLGLKRKAVPHALRGVLDLERGLGVVELEESKKEEEEEVAQV
jgi:hypothetical protein